MQTRQRARDSAFPTHARIEEVGARRFAGGLDVCASDDAKVSCTSSKAPCTSTNGPDHSAKVPYLLDDMHNGIAAMDNSDEERGGDEGEGGEGRRSKGKKRGSKARNMSHKKGGGMFVEDLIDATNNVARSMNHAGVFLFVVLFFVGGGV